MTKRRNNRVIILVLIVAVLIVGSNVLMGRVIEDREVIINIDSKATTDIWIQETVKLSAGQEFDMGDLDHWKLVVWYTFTDNNFVFPDNVKFDLVVDGVVLTSSTNAVDLVKQVPTYQVTFNNLGAIAQGKHSCFVKVSGNWIVGPNSEGMYVFYELRGNSFVFYLSSADIAKPNPVGLTNNPVDITVAPYSTSSLTWNYEYAGTLAISIEDNGAIIHTASVPSSVVSTPFIYLYYASVSGSHEIIAHFLPMDSSGNDEVSDSVLVFVTTGGDAPDFPPSVDRVDISVTQDVVGEGATSIFVTGWYSDVAQKGAYSTLIDGMLDVEVKVQPTGAFLAMKVMISEKEYPLSKTTGWEYDVFSESIDTDVIDAGIHTVEIWGFDSDNAIWYKVGSFTIPIRTDEAGLDPLVLLGIVIAIVGVVIVIFMVKRNKR